ncbi:hypothetical protein, partial [Streptomyces sp. SID3343]|uniref:hypothetical protein n=1 Tax=Streptomyces sp. SID3343 TaxID=2690260 RepID=UPI0013694F43
RPLLARLDAYACVPARARVPGLAAGGETGRLATLVLTAGQPVAVRARDALVCLDGGPSGETVEAQEVIAVARWDGVSTVTVESTSRHPVHLAHPVEDRRLALHRGQAVEVPISAAGHWTVRFGPPDRVHRFLRFAAQRTSAR